MRHLNEVHNTVLEVNDSKEFRKSGNDFWLIRYSKVTSDITAVEKKIRWLPHNNCSLHNIFGLKEGRNYNVLSSKSNNGIHVCICKA